MGNGSEIERVPGARNGSQAGSQMLSPGSSTSPEFDDRFLQKEYQDYFDGKGPRPQAHPVKDHELNIRLWEDDLKKWYAGTGDKPGNHPIDNHDYNLKPELYNDIV